MDIFPLQNSFSGRCKIKIHCSCNFFTFMDITPRIFSEPPAVCYPHKTKVIFILCFPSGNLVQIKGNHSPKILFGYKLKAKDQNPKKLRLCILAFAPEFTKLYTFQ